MQRCKNIKTCEYLWNQLSENSADRQSLLINLGGGVVTDIGGFVASTFMRGIQFINIPTTLLARPKGMLIISLPKLKGV